MKKLETACDNSRDSLLYFNTGGVQGRDSSSVQRQNQDVEFETWSDLNAALFFSSLHKLPEEFLPSFFVVQIQI